MNGAVNWSVSDVTNFDSLTTLIINAYLFGNYPKL